MVSLISRAEVVETKKVIGSELAKIQIAYFDESDLRHYVGEENLYLDLFDCLKYETVQYEQRNRVIGLDHSNINTFTAELTGRLRDLFQVIDAKEFYMLAHLKIDFFGNRANRFQPLVKAYKKLEAITRQKSYKEAFKFDLDDLEDLLEILFWTTRCDASIAEYIFLFDAGEQIQINLCKYGNLHLTNFGPEKLSDEQLVMLGWNIIDGPEYDNFSDDGRIDGRSMRV